MKNALDFIIVGTGPLGSAIRAAILGAFATTLGRMFFEGWWQPLILGIVLCCVLLPIAYMISSRDDQHAIEPYSSTPPMTPPAAKPEDANTNLDKDQPHRG